LHNQIDPLEAWTKLGIYRLAAVVHLLRQAGIKIKTERMEVSNRFNEVCNVANYVLEK
jgi:hypothetical protein